MEVRGLCESLSIYFPPALYADVAVRALQSAFTVHQELSERKVRNSFEWMALLLCRYVLLNQPHSDEIWLPLIISAAPDNPYGPCLRALLLESGSAGNISVVQALAARWHRAKTNGNVLSTPFFEELLLLVLRRFPCHPDIPEALRSKDGNPA